VRLEALRDLRLAGVEIKAGEAFEVLDGSAARMLLAAGAAAETARDDARVTIASGGVTWSEPSPELRSRRAPTWMTNYGEWK